MTLLRQGTDSFGNLSVSAKRKDFSFKFKEGAGTAGRWEGDRLDRYYEALVVTNAGGVEPAVGSALDWDCSLLRG